MSMNACMTNEKTTIRLKCQHCGWTWDYHGKRKYYAGCSVCRHQVSIAKNRIEMPYPGQKVSSPDLNMVGESTPSTPTKEPMIDHEMYRE
jgi:hypothetical protein